MNTLSDGRYSTALGAAVRLYFCGELLRSYDTFDAAEAGAVAHIQAGFNVSDWVLVVRVAEVLILRDERNFRIVFGDEVRETKSEGQAAHWFGELVLKSLGVM
jgi:hypothetical protein